MTGIRIGKGVDYIYTRPPYPYRIDIGIFRGCSSLVSVVLPFIGSSPASNIGDVLGYVFGQNGLYSSGMVKVNQKGYSYYIPATLRDVTILGNGSYAVPSCAMENLNMISSI